MLSSYSDSSCSADVNVPKKVSEEENIYGSRPSKSHGSAVRLTVFTSILRSCCYWSLSLGKVKSILCPRSSSDWLDSNGKVIDGLCEDPIVRHIRKKYSLVSPTNRSQDSLISFFNFSHGNLPTALISRFLA